MRNFKSEKIIFQETSIVIKQHMHFTHYPSQTSRKYTLNCTGIQTPIATESHDQRYGGGIQKYVALTFIACRINLTEDQLP